MIRAILEYAIDQGIALQIGTLPTGETMIPSEVENSTCAELIRECLKLHPDWIPAIDHSTTPPTINVLPSSDTEGTLAASFDLTGGTISEFEIRERADMIPDSVRIVYELVSEIDGEVYRKTIIDKYPVSGPDAGPRVISATIPLAGLQMQIQKSRIQVRPLPADQSTAIAFLKEKFPALAAIADADLKVTKWAKALVTEDPDFPDPISDRAPRLAFADISQATNELVRGTIEDWMRKRTGPVEITFEIVGRPTLSDDEKDLIASLPRTIVVTATNAITKTYRGISQWVAAEDVPTGIAQATYEAILAAMSWEGSLSFEEAECGAVSYAGKVINLAGGAAGWGTMRAPVHAVECDIASGRTTIAFGPNPTLAPADFLELQRILRYRPTRWWSIEERDSDQIGAAANPSAAGDTVSGFEHPKTEPTSPVPAKEQFGVGKPFYDATGETWHVRAEAGEVLAINPEPGGGSVMIYLTATALANQIIASGGRLWVKVTTDKNDLATAAAWYYNAAAPTQVHAQPDPGGNNGEYYYWVCDFGTVGGNVVITARGHLGGPIIHRPARNNRNADLEIQDYWENTDGELIATGEPRVMSWRQGLYVGEAAPAVDGMDVFHAINLVGEPPPDP
jgi:hypothetical protein